MKTPIIISSLLVVLAASFLIWISGQGLEKKDLYSLFVSAFATAGAFVSVVFVIYGYFISLTAFKESQKPRLLLQVHNDRANLNNSGENVHMTIIVYANVSAIECKGLQLYVRLVNEQEVFDVPRLFSSSINLPANDNRTRDFPTKRYLADNGIDQHIIDNLQQYKLRVGYSYQVMNETMESYYDYAWAPDREWWNIA